jgi:hypothetical protein
MELMNSARPRRITLQCCIGLLVVLSIAGYAKKPSVNGAMEKPLSANLKKLFAKTKSVCFGRYVLTVPAEAELVWGSTHFPSMIASIPGGSKEMKEKIASDIAKLRAQESTFDLTFNGPGPVPGSWQIRYYEDDTAKQFDLHFFVTYVNKGNLIFILRGATDEKGQDDEMAARESLRATNLRLRSDDEVPQDPGFCLEHAFIASSDYRFQEIVNVGVYFPSHPDISFSFNSNKDAYGDYSKEAFERLKREELSLLARIHQSQQEQGAAYPNRTLLREGPRAVQHWRGEESLIRRPDGVHDFEWGYVGTPKNVVYPPEMIVNMHTMVDHGTVGAAKAASLSDEEAVALWDRLLSELRFRVEVPGAPAGSFRNSAPGTK